MMRSRGLALSELVTCKSVSSCFQSNSAKSRSIESSDVSICVLSLDEIVPRTVEAEARITIPHDVTRHLKPDTVFLLNKSDLAHISARDLPKALNDALPQHASEASRHFWSVSLRSGEGTREFLDGLASVLKERYA